MPYRRNNYDFVIDSSFQPFSMQELLTPMLMYKENFEKMESAYEDLSSKADKFKYLSQTLPEGSQSRQIYEGYANELNQQAEDLAKNGLSMSNRRALTNLKRRYQGEIGRLDLADQALQEERKLRRQMSAKDSSMLYALDNLSIDSFLDGNTPNLYNISGNDLYTKGAIIGKNFSSRVYGTQEGGKTLGGYYRDYIQRKGYTQDQLNRFSNEIMDDFAKEVSVLPELQQAAKSLLDANGVTENLTGNSLRKAQQQVIRGIVDNAVYEEDHKLYEDKSVISAAQRAQLADNRDARALNAALYGFKKDAKGNWVKDDEGTNVKSGKSSSGSGGSSKRGSSTDKVTQSNSRTKVVWQGGNPEVNSTDAKNYKPETVANDESSHPGILYEYDDLPAYAQDVVDNIVKDGRYELYDIYFSPLKKGAIWNDMPELEVVPRKVVTDEAQEASALQSLFGAGGN